MCPIQVVRHLVILRWRIAGGGWQEWEAMETLTGGILSRRSRVAGQTSPRNPPKGAYLIIYGIQAQRVVTLVLSGLGRGWQPDDSRLRSFRGSAPGGWKLESRQNVLDYDVDSATYCQGTFDSNSGSTNFNN
jgi:hypothetical protein